MSSSVTDSQQKIFEYQRENYFKGTIAVATIYGSVALIMFLIAILTEAGKSILTERLLPFTVTFIGGMIVVTILMVVSVFAVKPPPVTSLQYDNMKCPDFWRLEATPKTILDNYPQSDQYLMKYMCINDKINGELDDAPVEPYMTPLVQVQPNDTDSQALYDAGADMYGMFNTKYTPPNGTTPGSGNIYCGAVFPDKFSSVDTLNNKAEPNRLRCKYAKLCNTPWSSVCPNQV